MNDISNVSTLNQQSISQKASTPLIILKKVPNFKLLHSRSSKSVKDFIQENKIPKDYYENMPQFSVCTKEIGNHKSRFLDEIRRTQSCPPNKRSSLLYKHNLSQRLSNLVQEAEEKLVSPERELQKINLSRQISQNEAS